MGLKQMLTKFGQKTMLYRAFKLVLGKTSLEKKTQNKTNPRPKEGKRIIRTLTSKLLSSDFYGQLDHNSQLEAMRISFIVVPRPIWYCQLPHGDSFIYFGTRSSGPQHTAMVL